MCGKVDEILSTIDKKPISAPFTLAKNASAGWDPLTNNLASFDEHNAQTGAKNPWVQGAGTIAASIYGGPAGAAAAQAAFARENGGSWEDAAKRAAITYAGGSAMQGLGSTGDVTGGVDEYGSLSDGSGQFSGGGVDTTDYGSGTPMQSYDASSTPFPADGSATPMTPSQSDYFGASTASADGSNPGVQPWNGPTNSTVGGGGSPSDFQGDYGSPEQNYDPQNFSGGGRDYTDYGNTPTAAKGPSSWWQDPKQLGKLNMYQGGLKTLGGLMDYGPMNNRADDIGKQRQAYENQLNSYYAPGSPEAAALKAQMDRKDAAAGRNSQYGTRATDLAAKIATMQAENRARSLPTLFNMNQAEGQLRNQSTAGIMGGVGQMGMGWGLQSLWS